jgi:hypothetical protein
MNIITITWNNKKIQLPVSELPKVCLELCGGGITERQTGQAMQLQAKVLKARNASIGIYSIALSEEL